MNIAYAVIRSHVSSTIIDEDVSPHTARTVSMLVTHLQPTRPRPPRVMVRGDVWRQRTMTVGAQEMLGSDVVVSAPHVSDIVVFVPHTPGWHIIQQNPSWKRRCLRVPFLTRQSRQVLRVWVKNERWLQDTSTSRFVLIRFSWWQHIIAVLWDRRRNLIEIFDPAGKRRNGMMCIAVLRAILSDRLLWLRCPRMTIVNRFYLQQHDHCCLAWMYRYAVDRIIKDIHPRALVQQYRDMPTDVRKKMILDFYEELLTR